MAKQFYKMMKTIAYDMHQATGVFHIKNPCQDGRSILDMCMAPGGFLAIALSYNPQARALAFSLPKINGGHVVLLPKRPNVTLKFLDVTMLAEDMGTSSIPYEHPDARNFLSSQFSPREYFDLILCDGQVLRNHGRADYRERTEASRLCLTQLTLALNHLKPGGTMIVLLHKVEALHTVQLLNTFDRFASVQLFKHTKFHAKRSSFYMLATNIRADSEDAKTAIERWKFQWNIATFGTDNDYCEAIRPEIRDVQVMLKAFGPKLIELGRKIWDIQANALENAPFMRQTSSS
jgi:23S rRNA U2552 (ribose-2'-O)-methylase RlmE/FtsJ